MSTFALDLCVPSARTGALAAGGLTVESEGTTGTVVVRPVGELDMATAPVLEKALRNAQRPDASALVVDLSRLEFIDSFGITALMVASRDAQATACAFVLCAPQRPVRKVLRLTGLDHLVGDDTLAGRGLLPSG